MVKYVIQIIKYVLVKLQQRIVVTNKPMGKHVLIIYVQLLNVLMMYNVLIILMELYVLQI
jgi:hypothetical protein